MSGTSGTRSLPVTRILGIDPGLRVTGFGLIDQCGSKLNYVASGVIRVPDGELPMRLATIFTQIREVIASYQPQQCAIEKVFVNVNPHSTLLLGQARGSAICAMATLDLPVAEYTALQIKQSVVGYGKASKEQVQEMTMRLLQLPGKPSRDAADALACAMCHAQSAALLQTVAAALPNQALRGQRLRRGRLTT